MDGIKPGRGTHTNRPHSRPASSSTAAPKNRHNGQRYFLVRSIGKVASKKRQTLWNKFRQTSFAKWPDKYLWRRVYAVSVLFLFVFSTVAGIVQPFLDDKFYGVTPAARSVLPQPNANLGNFLNYNDKEAVFDYNEGYNGASGELSKSSQGEPRISATVPKESSKGMKIIDPLNKVDFSMVPKFKLNAGKQDRNQVFYPLVGNAGYLVYTMQVASVKEDIVLEKKTEDRLVFEYELKLGDSLEARLEKNGSIGVYGASLPVNGNVATGSEADVALLNQVRQNAEKDNLLFVIPKPVVVEPGKQQSNVNSWFELKDNHVSVVSEGLHEASYPLSIDPSVYVQSAAQLMRGNNETNVEFDVATEQFKKGTTTGARIDEWTDTTEMSNAAWDQGMAAAGGYVYRAGGKTSRVMPRVVSMTSTIRDTAPNGTITVNMPTDRPNTDLYVAVIGIANAAANSVPSGWTAIRSLSNQLGTYYLSTSGSVASTYTWTANLASQYSVVVLRITNVDMASPINATGGASASVPPINYPSLTATNNGTLVIGSAGYNTNVANTKGFSPANDWSDIISQHVSGTGGAGNPGILVSSLDSPPLASTPTGSAATNAGFSSGGNYSASTFAINGIATATSYKNSVEWAHFNSTNGSVDSPAPGSNELACSGWCTNSDYDLPTAAPSASNGAGLVGASLVAYNGYLYNIGGYDGNQVKNTIYVSKLGSKGEPSKWHPSDPNQASWNYWYKDTGLGGGNERAYHGAYAYNGKMYVIGGRTSMSGTSPNGQSTVMIADILPNGTLGSWTNGPSIGSARYGLAVQGYNGYIYAIGGNNGTSVTGSVIYSKINTDGSINAWQPAATGQSTGANLIAARTAQGGVMAGIWGGYLYVAGGCSAVNTTGSGHCTSISGTVEIASINADGSLNDWNNILNLRNQRFGYSFIAWQDSLYRFGGCARQDSGVSGDCYAAFEDVQYGNINQDGDASTVSVTTESGVGLCQGGDPYDCNLPPLGKSAGQSAHMLSSTAILNGYLYVIGGCIQTQCDSNARVSNNISYVGISSDGKLKSPPSCQYSQYGSWCVDNVNTINGTVGIAASGVTVFGGNIYVVGGLNGTANVGNVWRNTTNSDGSLSGGWGAQTFANLALGTAVSYTFAYSRANPASTTYPGNLYVFGGCAVSSGPGCTSYASTVYKCNILASGALEEANANDCVSDDGAGGDPDQLQIDSEAAAGDQGLGIHAGAVYANYIYLVGGVSPNQVDRKSIIYAKFDNNNNVVAVNGGSWVQSNIEMNTGRRRGTAFGYNGYLYAVGGFEATIGQALDTIEFVKVNVSDGSLISDIPHPTEAGVYLFKKSAVTINQRWGLSLAVSNSFAYIIGGCNVGVSPGGCSSFDATIQTFQVYNNDSGAPAGYIKAGSSSLFANDRIGGSAAIRDGYLYIAGGCVSATDCTTATTSVQYTQLDAYGNVGSWQAGGNLPAARAWGQLEIAGNSLYYVGGQSSSGTTAQTTVYYSTGFTGASPSWGSASNGLPAARTRIAATVWNNRIYVVGGNAATSGTENANIYVSPQLNSGGNITSSWSTSSTALSVARSGATAIAYANNLYVLGGYSGSVYLSDVQFAKIDDVSGNVTGSWTYTTSLPNTVSEADGFAVNGYMYLIGGRTSANDCQPRTLVAPISANTTIASGNNPTGIGEWYETNRKFDSGRYGAAVTYGQGKAYVLGGGCQGVVMQDDFDPDYDPTQWSAVPGMTAGTTCQSTSTSNVFYMTNGNSGNNYAATNPVNVPSGGTVHFKLYAPTTTTAGCFSREQDFVLFGTSNPDNIQLQYCKTTCSVMANWTNANGGVIATYAWNTNYSPLTRISATIPAGGFSPATQFRWVMPQGEGSDSFAIEDVYIIANGSSEISYTGESRVAYTSLLSQPQVSQYSRLIDAGKDVFPTNFLLNGIDNSIGARWQVSYRSMNDNDPNVADANKCGGSAMTSYGQTTFFGNVTLGKPERYYSRNSGGGDIGCGRYYFMTISIDASQTYGYPEDINRGPTLDNFLIFFQSNPGQRLLHGKTFLEGSQQPLDTPCRQSGGSNNSACTLP